MISLVPFFDKAIKHGVSTELMCDWLKDFFTADNEEYGLAAGNGSAKNSNIIIRHNALTESFDQFFSEV